MVIWRLPAPDLERPHGLKYRLYYGQSGQCLVRYDNERGKGDHQHYGDGEGNQREESYAWISVQQLVADFKADINDCEGNDMTKQHIHIGTEAPDRGFDRFVDAWQRAERSEQSETEVHLNFADLSMLLAVMTPRRLDVLKTLRQQGPMSVRALATMLSRDYKNVHADTRALEEVGLLERTEFGVLQAPWDGIDAHLSLVA
jgi:predicted transcriptional regulator